jgi:hypothetical protein
VYLLGSIHRVKQQTSSCVFARKYPSGKTTEQAVGVFAREYSLGKTTEPEVCLFAREYPLGK